MSLGAKLELINNLESQLDNQTLISKNTPPGKQRDLEEKKLRSLAYRYIVLSGEYYNYQHEDKE